VSRATAIAILAAAVLSAGCASDFDPASRVQGLRILATRVDKPYAAPGETVTFETLAVDPEGRPVSVSWAACARPASPSALGCVRALPKGAPLTTGSSFTLTVPPTALDGVPAIARKSVFFGAVQVACRGSVTTTGGPEGLPVRCGDERNEALPLGDYELAVKRVYVRATDKNQNPTIARVIWDGTEWPEDEVKSMSACDSATSNRFDECNGESHTLAIVPADDSSERGVDELGDAFEEKLLAQYYSTEGIFEYQAKDGVRSETAFKARRGASGKTITLWFVVRDDRGGVDWTARRISVR
jgi:hypothetical protein